MSQLNFIQEADQALTNHIWNTLKSDSANRNIIISQDQIALSPPKAAQTQKTGKLSIFLYNIGQEAVARNQVPSADASGKRQPQVCFELHYLIVPHTGNDVDDHVLLGKVIQAIASAPLIGCTPDAAGFKVAFESLSLGEAAALWTALGVPLQLSATVILTSAIAVSAPNEPVVAAAVPVSPAASAVPESENVRKLYEVVNKTFTEQADGWKKSNMLRKQFVSQDFKKVTDMSVDEMQAAVNVLGDKLEMNRPTAQFIKPLNLLAQYYEHQASELKGLRGVSKKQKENVEMISQWITDVKALVAALSSQKS
jgi:hypothetical protein